MRVPNEALLPGIRLEWAPEEQVRIDAIHFWGGKFDVNHGVLSPPLETAAILKITGAKREVICDTVEWGKKPSSLAGAICDEVGVPPTIGRSTRFNQVVGKLCTSGSTLQLDTKISLEQEPDTLYCHTLAMLAGGATWHDAAEAFGFSRDWKLTQRVRDAAEGWLQKGDLRIPYLLLHAFGAGILRHEDGDIKIGEPYARAIPATFVGHVAQRHRPMVQTQTGDAERKYENNRSEGIPELFRPFSDPDKLIWTCSRGRGVEAVRLDALGASFYVSNSNDIITPDGKRVVLNTREKLALLLCAQGASPYDIDNYALSAHDFGQLLTTLGLQRDAVGYMRAACMAHQFLAPHIAGNPWFARERLPLGDLRAYIRLYNDSLSRSGYELSSLTRRLFENATPYKEEDAPYWCRLNVVLLMAHAHHINTRSIVYPPKARR